MKYKHLIAFSLLFAVPTITKNPSPERAQNAQIVLSNLAQMIGQIGNIIENPHDADHVGESVSNMVNNIIKITVNAVQKKSITSYDGDKIMEQLYDACKNFDISIAHKIWAKKTALRYV